MILTLRMRRKIFKFLFSNFEGENTNTTKGRSSENSISILNMLQRHHPSPTLPLKSWKLFLHNQRQNLHHGNHLEHLQGFEAGHQTVESHNLHLQEKKDIFSLLWCAKLEVNKTATSKIPYFTEGPSIMLSTGKGFLIPAFSSYWVAQLESHLCSQKPQEPFVWKKTCCPWNISCNTCSSSSI